MSIQNVTNPNVKSWLNGYFNNLNVAGSITGAHTDYSLNAGVVTGFDPIVDNGNGTVNVPGGDAYMRSSNSDTAPIDIYTVTAVAPLALSDLQNNFVCIDYNAGTPIIMTTTSEATVNENDRILLFLIYRSGTELTITKRHQKAVNNDKYIQQFFREEYINRRTDGLGLGETGVRNVTVTIGTIWTKLNKLVTTNFDTLTGSTFNRYFLVGASYTRQTGQTLWDNANWNNTATGLVPLTASYYSFQDFYMLMNDTVVSMYATAEYPALSVAEEAPIVPIVPELVEHSVYIGRIVFQQGAVTASAILSPFGTDIDPVSSVGDHTHLINLAVDSHLQYATLANRGGETLNIDNITLANTFEGSVNDKLINASCAGYVSGFGITDNLDGTVDITAGTGYIRSTNSDTADMEYFSIAGVSSLALADNAENYIYVLYGSPPTINATTSGSTIKNNENDRFEIYEVYRQGTILHITEHAQKAVNNDRYLQQRLYEQSPGGLTRTAGLIISDTGTRNVATTAGTMWLKLNKIAVSAVDTSGADTFDRYYYNFTGATWVTQTAQTQWDNTQYNVVTAGTGLVAMLPNRWSYQEYFMETDGQLKAVYGDNQYLSRVLAESAPVQTFFPDIITEHALYIGRIVYQTNAPTGTAINPFDTQLSFAGVTDHGSLTGLGDDDHPQYALLAGRAGGQTLNGGVNASDGLTLESTSNVTKGSIILDDFTLTGGTIQRSGDITIDALNVATDSTVNILNSDGTYEANLIVEGDISTDKISGNTNPNSYIDFNGATDMLFQSNNEYYFTGNPSTGDCRFSLNRTANTDAINLYLRTAGLAIFAQGLDPSDNYYLFSHGAGGTIMTADYTTGDVAFLKEVTLNAKTASSLLRTNGTKQIDEVTIGNSISFDGTTLDTIQDIRTTASPTFQAVALSGGTEQISGPSGNIDFSGTQINVNPAGLSSVRVNGNVTNGDANFAVNRDTVNDYGIMAWTTGGGSNYAFELQPGSSDLSLYHYPTADTIFTVRDSDQHFQFDEPVEIGTHTLDGTTAPGILNITCSTGIVRIDGDSGGDSFLHLDKTASADDSTITYSTNSVADFTTGVRANDTFYSIYSAGTAQSEFQLDRATGDVKLLSELNLDAKTASSILRTDGSKNVDEVTIGTGVNFDGTTLSIGQAVGTTDAVTFDALTLTGTETITIGGHLIDGSSGGILDIQPEGSGLVRINGNPNAGNSILSMSRDVEASDQIQLRFASIDTATNHWSFRMITNNDFKLYNYNLTANALVINEATSNALFAGQVQTSSVPSGATDLCNKTYVDAKAVSNLCHAYVSGSPLSNVTGDGTAYTILFNSERYDTGSNYVPATGIYTVPSNGYYLINARVELAGVITGTHTSCELIVYVAGNPYDFYKDVPQYTGNHFCSSSMTFYCTTGQTIYVTIDVGGSSKVVDVWLNSSFEVQKIAS